MFRTLLLMAAGITSLMPLSNSPSCTVKTARSAQYRFSIGSLLLRAVHPSTHSFITLEQMLSLFNSSLSCPRYVVLAGKFSKSESTYMFVSSQSSLSSCDSLCFTGARDSVRYPQALSWHMYDGVGVLHQSHFKPLDTRGKSIQSLCS